MTLELQLVQSSKRKSKKDRKRKDRAIDVSSPGDLAVDEGEEREKKRKERKRKREGAIDGALSFSLALKEC
jgi:hypothetical protein